MFGPFLNAHQHIESRKWFQIFCPLLLKIIILSLIKSYCIETKVVSHIFLIISYILVLSVFNCCHLSLLTFAVVNCNVLVTKRWFEILFVENLISVYKLLENHLSELLWVFSGKWHSLVTHFKTSSIYNHIARSKLKSFEDMTQKTKLKYRSGDTVTVHVNPELVFRRALVLANCREDVTVEKVLSFPMENIHPNLLNMCRSSTNGG